MKISNFLKRVSDAMKVVVQVPKKAMKPKLTVVAQQVQAHAAEFALVEKHYANYEEFCSAKALKALVSTLLRHVDLNAPPGLAGLICEDLAKYEKRFMKKTRPFVALSVMARCSAHRLTIDAGKVSFLGLVAAESASGKEAQQQYQKDVYREAGLYNSIAGEPRSDLQMLEALCEFEVAVYVLDEIHSWFGKGRGASSSNHEKAMLDLLLKISTTRLIEFPLRLKTKFIEKTIKDIEELEMKGCQTTEENVELETKHRVLSKLRNGWIDPIMILIGYSTPINLDSLICRQTIESGLIGRFLFLRVDERDVLNKTPTTRPCDEIVQRCSALLQTSKALTLSEESNEMLTILISYFELHEHRNHPQLGALYARGVEHIKRVASILAMETSVVEASHLLYAAKLYMSCIESCQAALNSEKSGSWNARRDRPAEEVAREIVLHELEKQPQKAGVLANRLVKRSRTVREVRKISPGYEHRLLEQLVAENAIVLKSDNKYHIASR
jgi:hypothetical protein